MRQLVRLMLAGSALASAGEAEAQWRVSDQRDPITDATEVQATLTGEGGIMQFMCSSRDRGVVLTFQPQQFLGGPLSRYEFRDIWFRFDEAAAMSTRWKYRGDYAAAPSESVIADMLRRMNVSRRLVVRALSYDNAMLDATFDLTGTAEAIREAGRRCTGQDVAAPVGKPA